ncbi:hypothetical protein [Streptomyces sp. NPDC003952]
MPKRSIRPNPVNRSVTFGAAFEQVPPERGVDRMLFTADIREVLCDRVNFYATPDLA